MNTTYTVKHIQMGLFCFRFKQNKIIHTLDYKAILFTKRVCAIFDKKRGGVWFYANKGKFPVDGGEVVMIKLVTSKERSLSRLWDSSDFLLLIIKERFECSSAKGYSL